MLVNLPGRVVEPTLALFSNCARAKLHQEMNVIWHHDCGIEIVSLTIEMTQGTDDDFRQFSLAKFTRAVARIEVPMPTTVAMLAKLR